MTARRRGNALLYIQVDGVQVDGVEGIRGAVFQHSQKQFKSVTLTRSGVEELMFNLLFEEEGATLTSPFFEEEIKQTV